jgi:formylglycine-generating enzyme required for sulfatase activity
MNSMDAPLSDVGGGLRTRCSVVLSLLLGLSWPTTQAFAADATAPVKTSAGEIDRQGSDHSAPSALDNSGLNATWVEGKSNLPRGFVWIEPGTFVMGSARTEVDSDNVEGPQTTVKITHGFWMGIHEVTQREFSAVMHENPSQFKGDLLPVEQVTWFAATNFCAKLTQQTRQTGELPPGYSFRLPTEAEWEYACRAGTTTRFSYGDDPGYGELGKYAWYRANSGNQTHVGGQKRPNPWGLYDMYGNVFEWCSTWYAPYPGGTVVDPKGPRSGANRAMRGGSWLYYGGDCRSASRGNYDPTDGLDDFFGFRLVLGRD